MFEKIKVTVLMVITLAAAVNLSAQEIVVDSKGNSVPAEMMIHINAEFSGVPLADALFYIASQVGFHLNYNEEIILAGLKISGRYSDEPAFLILKKILKGTDIDIIVLNTEQVILTRLKKNESFIPAEKFTISGYVTDSESGEALAGANIYVKETGAGCTTNAYGFYSLTLDPDVYLLRFSYLGYGGIDTVVNLSSDMRRNVELKPSSVVSDTIVVISKAENEFVSSTNLGTISLSPEIINSVPVFLGEQDLMKAIQLLPGISNYREGDCGIYVRGGDSDQNLILLDEAPIYNAFHTFGLFSVFNSDAIRNINVIKGTAPAKYGGRLSSVVDMQMKEGNMKQFSGIAGLGIIFSRLTLQGPLIDDKASYLISGRRTYFDLFTRLGGAGDFKFNFYDLNAKMNYKVSDEDRIYVSGYFGRDGFGFSDEFNMDWGNTTGTIRWNHLFSNKLFLNSSFIYSNFKYEIDAAEDDDENTFSYLSDVDNITVKEDLEYFLDSKNTFGFGAEYSWHSFLPAKMELSGDHNYSFTIGKRNAVEFGIYVSHECSIGESLKLEYGLRTDFFSVEGEEDQYNFNEIEELDVDFHGREQKTYAGFEPRLSAVWMLDQASSLKFGLSRNYQYIHQISNSNSGTPLDVWQPCGSGIQPARADQISLGYFRNIGGDYEFSAEIYYKDLRNQIDYKDGADFFLKNYFNSELVFGKGWAYGLELLLRKNSGNLSGWLAYTLSTSRRQFDDVNAGRPFPARNDKPHDFNLVAQYKLGDRWVVSANWIYTSGFTITIPTGRYTYDGNEYMAYTDRNGYRLPPYHRLDFGISYTNDLGGTWNLTLYNAYARRNIYTILFRDKSGYPGVKEAVKLTLFSVIPSLSYTLRF